MWSKALPAKVLMCLLGNVYVSVVPDFNYFYFHCAYSPARVGGGCREEFKTGKEVLFAWVR